MEQIKSGDSIDIEIIEHTEDSIPPERKIEIADKDVLARLSAAMPGLMNFVTDTATAGKMGQLYEVRGLVKGMELAKSGNMPNAFRGIIKDSGGKIIGQANLVNAGESALGVANAVSSVMNVASMIVGQYYMSKLSDQLGELNAKVDEILRRNDDEIRAKIIKYSIDLKSISARRAEIFEHDDERKRTLDKLYNIEDDCKKCIIGACVRINRYCDEKLTTYKTFEEKSGYIENNITYKNAFYCILRLVCELKCVFDDKDIPIEYLHGELEDYFSECPENSDEIENFGKNLEAELYGRKHRYEKLCKAAGIVSNIGSFGILSSIEKKTDDLVLNEFQKKIDKISDKRRGLSENLSEVENLRFCESDLSLLLQDGKLYYLKP